MCTGLEIAALASLATTVAGSATAAYGANEANNESFKNNVRVADARNQELANTLAMNRKNEEKARAEFEQREQEIQPDQMTAKQDELTQDRTADLEGAVEGSDVADVSLKGSSSEVVKSEIAKKLLEATGKAKEHAQNAGKLGGYGDLWFDQGLQNTEAGRDIDIWNSFSQANMGLLPQSQDFAAYKAYKPSSGVGETMQAFGSALGQAGSAIGDMAGGKNKKYASSYTVMR